MLLVSFLLVIVATIFLLSGLFLTKDLALIFISIACSALAGIVLVVAVMRSRPRPAAEPAADDALTPAPEPEPVAAEAGAERRAPAARPAGAREFPIPDYDRLEVVEVLPLLGDLEPAELEMVRQREASGRAHPWILARVDALLEAEAEADTSEHAWAPGPIGTAGQQGRLLDDHDDDGLEIVEVEPDDADWASPRDRDWAAADFELDSGSGYADTAGGPARRASQPKDFPIDRYDELRVTEILPLLAGLDAEDLKMVREEEAAGKARASILARIDGLLAREVGAPRPAAAPAKPSRPAVKAPSRAAAGLPIEGYDSLTVPQIQARLTGLSAPDLRKLRTYEQKHKNRAGVLQRIEGALRQAPR